MLDAAEVAKHNSQSSCWVIVSGNAYDVTGYLDQHPGGAGIILRYGGQDATEEYEPIHPPGTIEETLAAEKQLGQVDPSTIVASAKKKEKSSDRQTNEVMPLTVCQNLDDFEAQAKKVLTRKAWVYFESAADSLTSFNTNHNDWMKISFRPRVLRNVASVSMKQNVMGLDADYPIFIAPAALAKLGRSDGELCLARGAARKNVVYCSSTYSSVSHDDIASALEQEKKGGALAFQLYIPRNKEGARDLIAKAKRLRYTSLVITVDSPVIGKREEDERYKAELEVQEGRPVPRTTDPNPSVKEPILRGAHSSTVDWDDIAWICDEWGRGRGPVILKGIQTAEDALEAARFGVDGIYLSNHGGRQLDCAPSSIRTLLEIRKFCPEVLQKVDVYLDGGVRRGTDVIKALCLGAKGVGLGRPFMYALSGYGTDGVVRVIQLLTEEIETTMRLLGVTRLDQLNEYYINSKLLEQELPDSIDKTPRQTKL